MQTFKVLPTYSVTRQELRPCNCDRSIQWTLNTRERNIHFMVTDTRVQF